MIFLCRGSKLKGKQISLQNHPRPPRHHPFSKSSHFCLGRQLSSWRFKWCWSRWGPLREHTAQEAKKLRAITPHHTSRHIQRALLGNGELSQAGAVARLRLRLGSTIIGNTSNSHHGEVRSKMWADLSTTRPQGLLGNLLAHAWMVRPLLLRTVACSYLRALPMRPDKTAAPFKPKAKKFRGSAALDETKMQISRHPEASFKDGNQKFSKVQKMKSGESDSVCAW